MIEIINRQKKRLGNNLLRQGVKKILKSLGISSGSVSLVFCGRGFIRQLNRKAFGCDNPTDVIAFPLADRYDDSIGEVIVCVPEAVAAAPEYGHTWQEELWLYIIHGILHLLGYKDGTKKERARMEKKQNALLTLITLKRYQG
jgi:probable rRNA maturation factor